MNDEKTAVERLGLDQRLIKRWRLPERITGRYRNEDYSARVKECTHLYLEPNRGIFYTRVPHQEDGTLYAADTLNECRNLAWDAMREWWHQAEAGAFDDRKWERRIVIRYDGGGLHQGALLTGAAETPDSYDGGHDRAVDVVPCTRVGVLTYARYERALQPDGRKYDTREWEEDFEARLARWKTDTHRRTQEEHRRARPKRQLGTARVETEAHTQGWRHDNASRRDVPWNLDTWAQLGVFALRFGQLHQGLMAYLIDSDQELFLAKLADMSGRMLPAPEE